VGLVPEAAAAQLPQAVEEDGPRGRAAGLPLVHPGVGVPVQVEIPELVQGGQRGSIRPTSRNATASPFWRG
jgi:hypothetical protein